jgi:hypothetical protein
MIDPIEYPYRESLGSKKVATFPRFQQEKIEEIIDVLNAVNAELLWFDTLGDFPVTGEIDILYVDKSGPVLYIWDGASYVAAGGGGSGSVTNVSVATANGLQGSVVNPSTTPTITLGTYVNGIAKGNGTAFVAAVAGTDYSDGTSLLATGIVKSTTGTGVLSIAVAGDFPTLNQSTTGTASYATNLAGGAGGQIVYQSASNTTAFLANGGVGQVLQSNGGLNAPSWVTPLSGTVTSVSVASGNGFGGSVANPTTTPAITISTSVTGVTKGLASALVAATDSDITAFVLTGLSIAGGSITAADSIVDAFGKVQSQINGLMGGAVYQGVWDANLNNPLLTSGVGTQGYYYVVNVAGTTNLDGITTWSLGDWAIFNGTVWEKVDNTDAVISVNGNTGAVALTGTANRITVSGANVFDIDAAYAGQNSITTLGTVTSGTWNAGTIGTVYGGTNITSYTTGDVLYASGANVLSKRAIGTAGQVLTVSGGVPVWATPTVGTVTSVSGTTNRITSTGGATPVIDIAATYVGQTSLTTLGTIATGIWNGTTIGATFGGTSQSTYATGDILYASGVNTLSKLGAGVAGYVLTMAGGVPTWAISSGGTVTNVSWVTSQGVSASISNPTTIPAITITLGALTGVTSFNGLVITPNTGVITTGTWNGTVVGAPYGGTGQTVYAVGDLLQADTTTSLSKLPAVATGNVLLSGGVSTVSAWGKVGLTTHVSGVLPVANGGTNNSSIGALNGVAYSSGSALIYTAAGTTNQVLTANGAGTPNWTNSVNLADNISGGLGGQIHYQSAVNTTALLANGTAGQVLQSNGTTLAPSWVTPAGLSGGVANYLPLWTGASTLSTSLWYEDKANKRVGYNTTTLPAGSLLTLQEANTASGDDSLIRVIDGFSTNVFNLINKGGNGAYLGIGNLGAIPTANFHARGFDTLNTTFTFKAEDSAGTLYWSLRNDKRMVYVDGNQSAGRFLGCDANGVATWQAVTASTATNLSGGAGGQVVYQSALNTTSFLANGTSGQVLQSNGGTNAPSWVTLTAGITGTGTANTIMKWSSSTVATNSTATDDGSTFTVGGVLKLGTQLSNSTSGTTDLTANQTNWNLGNVSSHVSKPTADRTIQGVVAPSTTMQLGNEMTIYNFTGVKYSGATAYTPYNLIFINNSTTTTAANRIAFPNAAENEAIIVPPGSSITLQYDTGYPSGARWRVKSATASVVWPNQNSVVQSRRMTADVTKSANTTFANLSELTAVTVSGKKYNVVLELYCTTGVGTGGIKVDFTGTGTWYGFGELFEDTPALLDSSILTTLGDTVASGSTSSANLHVKIAATFVATSTTLIPRFAQNSASGSTTVKTQSTMIVTEVI